MVWQRLVVTTRRRSPAVRWALTALMFGLAIMFRLALGRFLAGAPGITFLPAIIGTTLLCGWPQAVTGTVVSFVTGTILLLPQVTAGGDTGIRAIIALITYILVSAFVIVIITAMVEAVAANRRLAHQEKILFLELQHRVANTLQLVAAMLSAARQGLTTPAQADQVLEQAVARVTAMGQLHRRMYDAASDGRGLAPLLRDILSEIFKDLNVTVAVQADLSTLSLSQMTPVVLLVTEAATNAAKHVFRAGRGSQFAVTLAEAAPERVCLTIRDDGPGLAQPAVPTSGLGLRIMQGLATQLGGRLEFESLAGTVVRVEFAKAH